MRKSLVNYPFAGKKTAISWLAKSVSEANISIRAECSALAVTERALGTCHKSQSS